MSSPSIAFGTEDHATWHGNGTGGVQIATALVTAGASLIVAMFAFNTSSGPGLATITGVTSTSGLTWTKRTKQSESGTNHDSIEVWTAVSSGALAGEKVTVTTDINVNAGSMVMASVTGLNSTASPYDNNGGLPDHAAETTGTGNPPVTFSTNQTNDLLLFIQNGDKSSSGGTTLSGSGTWTNVFSTTNGSGALAFQSWSVFTQAVSATQTSQTVTSNGNSSANAVALVDAFRSDPLGESGPGVLAFGPHAFSASGTRVESGAAAMHFGPHAFSAAGTAKHTASGVLSFGPHHFSAAGVMENAGTGILHFGPIAIKAAGLRAPPTGTGKRQFWTFGA